FSESLPLLRSHLVPALADALGDPVRHAIGHAMADTGPVRTVESHSTEENPAQRQQSKRLPEGDLAPAKERRQQPVPQEPHDRATDRGEDQNRQDSYRRQDDQFPFRDHVPSSLFREVVMETLQSLAKVLYRVAFAREQRIHAHAGRGGHLLEAATFQLVPDEHLSLLLRQRGDRQRELIEQKVAY